MRRLTKVLSASLLALAACAGEKPRPAEPMVAAPPPKAVEPALAIVALTTETQTIEGLVLKLDGHLGPAATGRELSWSAKAGDREVGQGKLEVAGPGDFSAPLELTFGNTMADLAPYQDSEVQQLVVEVSVATGDTAVTESRSLRVRSPRLPEAKIVHVQSSRPDRAVLEMTFLLSIKNPNPWEIRVGTVTYTVMLADKTLITSDLPLASKVPGSSESTFEVPAAANAQNCGKDIGPMLKKPELPWAFTGGLKVGAVELPIDLKGTVKVTAE